MGCTTYCDFMLCEVKRAVLRECWLHIHLPFWFSLISSAAVEMILLYLVGAEERGRTQAVD
jgi:hypothetical protein